MVKLRYSHTNDRDDYHRENSIEYPKDSKPQSLENTAENKGCESNLQSTHPRFSPIPVKVYQQQIY